MTIHVFCQYSKWEIHRSRRWSNQIKGNQRICTPFPQPFGTNFVRFRKFSFIQSCKLMLRSPTDEGCANQYSCRCTLPGWSAELLLLLLYILIVSWIVKKELVLGPSFGVTAFARRESSRRQANSYSDVCNVFVCLFFFCLLCFAKMHLVPVDGKPNANQLLPLCLQIYSTYVKNQFSSILTIKIACKFIS